MSFSDLGLLAYMNSVVDAVAYTDPTPIQEQSIPLILEGVDLIAKAQTGTGKTAAFALPVLQILTQNEPDAETCPVRALVLTPTRELAQQVADAFKTFETHLPSPIGIAAMIGGEDLDLQVAQLRSGVQVVVATPGRLLELVCSDLIDLEQLRVLVIDEADRLLALGFAEELGHLFEAFPVERQTLLFSATYPKKVVALTQQILRNPVQVNASGDMPTVANIKQRVIEVNALNRRPLLCHLLKAEDWKHVLVFVKSKRAARNLAAKLRRDGIRADEFHGDLWQDERTAVLRRFKQRSIRVLVATDIAARGIDIENLSTVVNYDLPRSPVDYIHRIGRTGRAGADGVAVSFVDHNDQAFFKIIEKRTRQSPPREQIAGFELKGAPPEKAKGQPPVKGKRPSKKDKARAAAARDSARSDETDDQDSD
ncbi:MAG: DEAD/DEAH box helicase [Kiritimatiellae bacterium]|nr:DEAD/DEAH box helicase [Kiritimatiellia bacterium]